MSWLKAVPSGEDDVFDENGDDLSLLTKEWASNMKKRVKDGYVDGIDAGEEASLQEGFNQGFRDGAAKTVAAGRLRGIVCAIWSWWQNQHPESPVPASVRDLLQQITQHENAIVAALQHELENPPPSVSDVSESMEDLEVKPADSGCCSGGCEQGGCCRKGEEMDTDVPHPRLKLCSRSTDGSSSLNENMNVLVQRCMELVSELGLPQELTTHIQELIKV